MSKTNFAKRILSLFLSLMMIITSIPYFAITASAAEPSESGLVGSYLTKDVTTGIKENTGTISWDSTVGAAKFDGSGYLVLEGKPMEAVNSSTGFTISLDVMRTSNSQPMQRLLDFNNGGQTSTFALNGGSDGNVERYITLANPKGNELRYWLGNDLRGNAHATNTDYCSKTQAYDFLAQEKPGTWYNITITMEPSGSYSYYIDGELFVTYKPEYYSAKGTDVTPEKIMNSFSGFTNYMVGKAIYDDPAFTGYIKNLKLYDRAVDITSAIAGGGATNIEILGNAIKEYESRVQSKVFANTTDAYNAYVAANKAYDVVYYGGDSSVDADRDVITSTNNLVREILNMGKMNFLSFVQQTANVKPTFGSGDTNGYYSNVLYSSTGNPSTAAAFQYFSGGKGTWGQNGSYEAKCHTNNNVVLLYDGESQVIFPITLEGVKTKTTGAGAKTINVKTYSASTNNSSWYLIGDWIGQETSWSNFPSASISMSKTESDESKSYKFGSGNKTFVYGNGLKFKGSFTNDSYFQTFNSSNNIVIKHYMNGGVGEWKNYTHDLNVFDGASVSIINYSPLYELIKTGQFSELANVKSYREGGLLSYATNIINGLNFRFSSYDFSNTANVSICANDIKNIVNGLKSKPTIDNTDNYPALRKAFDHSGTISAFVNAGDNTEYSVRAAYNGGVRQGFSKASYDNFEAKYQAAQNVMKAVRTSGYVNDGIAGEAATALLAAFNALEPVNVKAPTLTESTVLGPNDTIIITNNETSGTVKYTITYDDDSTTAETVYSGPINVFNGSASYREAVVTAYCTVGTDDSKSVSQTYTFYKAPTIDANDGDLLTQGQTVAITSNNEKEGTIQYSYDNSTWKDYTDPVAPFTENKTTKENLYAREICGNATSATVQVLNLVKKATFNILSSTGDNSFDSTSTFTISDISGYEDGVIRYEINVDGTSIIGPNVYNAETGIVVSGNGFLTSAKLITITAYANSQSGTDQKVVAKFFNSDNYNPLAYQESFDGASVSGNSFTTGNSKGKNATILRTGTKVDGAGYKDGAGNSPDWRNNVLKLEPYTNSPGNKFVLAENPLTNETNKVAAQSSGATITFWRHIENSNGETISESDNWMGAVTFREKNTDGSGYPYFLISTTGYISYHNDSNNIHQDITPDEQGITKHSVGNKSGHWVQVAVTIDPNSGVKVYTNGELHGNSTSTDTNYAKAILNYITANNTEISINNSLHKGSSNTYFYDDIRIYSTAMTQTEINNMYVDKYADVQKKSATGHDPTTVTVYTLTSGDQVGENYVVKNNAYDQVASVEYYMFGTGMTIYHSTDAENWELIGDSQGRCNYQNEDLFGGPYTTALAEPLAVAAGDTDRVQYGAGNLVWAPHVMYNVTTEKWCYYGSTSSWGSGKSAIFLCTSDNITGPYTYNGIVVTSINGSPNAIDPVVFYDKDFSKLYMIYGSWGGEKAIEYINLNANGQNLGDGKSGVVCYGINTGLEPNSTDGSSGEGAYITYNNGYYYLYISYGQNYGTYTTRVFRSTDPVSGYVDIDGTSALDNTTSTMHGNQFMHSFDLPIYDYAYRSTGHNSVFVTKNVLTGEKVTLNTTHARPWTTPSHNMNAIEDTALSTRQGGALSEFHLSGNVTLVNQIGYTKSGWPVAMPYQYSANDTVRPDYSSADIQGTYNYQGFGVNVNQDILGYSEVTFTATGDYTGVMHNGTTAYDYVISKAEDGTTLINVYDNRGVIFEGVIGEHDDNRRRTVPQMGFVNVRTGENSWAYMTSQDQNISCSEQYNVTFENLFSFDKFVNSSSASTTTSKGTASYDAVNRTITTVCNVQGDNDNYTNHDDLSTVYKIPVTPGKTYYLDFTADNANADAMIFVPNEYDSGYDVKYTGFRGGHVNGHNRVKIEVPDGKNYVYFRFGSINEFGITVTFSNIVFYEASRADYRGSLGSEEMQVTCNQAYGALPTPTRIGYIFDGWYSDTDYNYPVTAETIAVHSPNAQSLYAKWSVCPHTNTRLEGYKAATCTEDGSTGTTICNTCGATVTGASVTNKLGHDYVRTMTVANGIYTWKDTCSRCGDVSLNVSVDANAYNAAVAEANASIKNTAKYTVDSRNDLQTVVTKNTIDFVKETPIEQSKVESATTEIQSANKLVEEGGKLVLESYTLTFNVRTDEKIVTPETKTYKYGEVVPLSVAEGILPYKWTKTVSTGDKYLAGATDTVSLVVVEDTTVDAWYNEQSTAPETTQHKITVLNKYNKAVSYIYVDDNTEITLSGSKISYNSSSYTIDKLPFYQITGYTINNEVASDKYIVTSDIEIKPIFTPTKEIVITLATDSIKFKNDVSSRQKTVKWDDRITVVADSEMMWYVDDVPVAKGNTYTFRASTSITITATPVEQATETPKSIVNYAQFDSENKKAIITVSNYQSQNYQIAEQGIIFGTSKNANAKFDKQLIIDKGKKYVANKTTDTGDQFSFSLTFDANTSVKTLCIVSYVKYVGQSEPVYSDEVTYVSIN